jgi:hypothetical protein
MSSRLFGFNKMQVNAYIDGLKKEQEEQIQNLELQISTASSEKERLAEEAKLLRSEKAAYDSEAGFMKLSFERVERAASLLNKDAQQESADILDSYKQRLVLYDAQISRIKTEIKDTMNSIEAMVQGIMGFLHNQVGQTDRIIEQTTETTTSCKVYPYTSRTQKKPSASQGDEIAENPKTEPEIKSELESAVIQGDFWGVDDFQIASNGTTIATKANSQARATLNRDSGSKTDFSVSAKGRTYIVPLYSEKSMPESTAGGFWESAAQGDEILQRKKHQVLIEEEVAASKAETVAAMDIGSTVVQVSAEETKPPAIQAKPEAPVPEAQMPEISTEARHEEANSSEQTIAKNKEQASVKEAAPAESSLAVAKEINRIRQKYISGKIAGEDLLDSKGSIIIAKNEVITDKIVERAEREGKLSELILSMILPELKYPER